MILCCFLQFIDYSINLPYVYLKKKTFCDNESWELFTELALRYFCLFTSESISFHFSEI